MIVTKAAHIWYLWDRDDGGALEACGDYRQEQEKVKDVCEGICQCMSTSSKSTTEIMSAPASLCQFTLSIYTCLLEIFEKGNCPWCSPESSHKMCSAPQGKKQSPPHTTVNSLSICDSLWLNPHVLGGSL